MRFKDLETGIYKVEVQIEWVKVAQRDYTLKVYSEQPVDLFECLGYEEQEDVLTPFEFCKDLRSGIKYRQGDDIDDEPTDSTVAPTSVQSLLSNDIKLYTNHLDNLDFLTKINKSWYREFIGQVHEDGKPVDKHLYSFSDKTKQYDLDVKIAAMCDAPAICLMFPRYYQSELEDKTERYGYDPA